MSVLPPPTPRPPPAVGGQGSEHWLVPGPRGQKGHLLSCWFLPWL